MSNVKRLAGDSSQESNIKAAEADHDPVKVTVTLTPLTQFIIEGALDMRTRSAAVRQLLDSAALDLLEAKGHTLGSDDFRKLYYRWLTRTPYKQYIPEEDEEVELYETIRL